MEWRFPSAVHLDVFLVGWPPEGLMLSIQGWSDDIDSVLAWFGLNLFDLIWDATPWVDVRMF